MKPLKIISHRGLWLRQEEKNSLEALARALEEGFGIETDLRDQNGQLVISHDTPTGPCLSFSRFLDLLPAGSPLPLALNIKADGLQPLLSDALGARPDIHYFVFDMSVPDALGYRNRKLRFFTRQSEYERTPSLLDSAAGVWVDQFLGEWVNSEAIHELLNEKKDVCIVSPELHRRPHMPFWKVLRSILSELPSGAPQIMLCTDHPRDAKAFFV